MAFSVDSIVKALGRIVGEVITDVAGDATKGSSSSSRRRTSTSRKSGSRSKNSRSSYASSTTRDSGIYEVPVSEALKHASYSPSPDGDADPGEVVWTWVPYQEDASQGKDRPVVVLGKGTKGLYIVQLTSKDHDRDVAQEARNGRYWLDIGSGAWDKSGRPSEVRLDRALVVNPSAIRREGATLPRDTWEMMLQALKKHA